MLPHFASGYLPEMKSLINRGGSMSSILTGPVQGWVAIEEIPDDCNVSCLCRNMQWCILRFISDSAHCLAVAYFEQLTSNVIAMTPSKVVQRYPITCIRFQQESCVGRLTCVFINQQAENVPITRFSGSSQSCTLLLVFLPYINSFFDQQSRAVKTSGIYSGMEGLSQLAHYA